MATESFVGQTYKVCPPSATTVVKARAGRLAKLVFTIIAAGTVTVYDHDSAAAGNVLYTVTNPALGQVVVLDVPAQKGIVCVTPAGITLNVVYS